MRPNWQYETCKCCTREQRLAWSVSNDLWRRAVIPYYSKGALCLECFLRMADDGGVVVNLKDIRLYGLVSNFSQNQNSPPRRQDMKLSTAVRRIKRTSKLLYLILFRFKTLTSANKPSEKYFSVGVHYK